MDPARLDAVRKLRLSSSALRAVLILSGEVGELCDAPPAEAAQHLMTRTAGLIGAGPVWWSVVGGPAQTPPDPGGATIASSQVYGVDESQLRRWQREFLELGGYRTQPMWRRMFERAGTARCFRRRDLVEDPVWYGCAHFNEYSRALGHDDVVAAAVPIGGGREVWLAAARALGERGFSARDRELLEIVTVHTAWLARRHAHPLRDERGRLRLDGARARLAPRHKALLALLLDGHSEKQIAAAAGLTPRTAHKYIEQIYRAFAVSSRAELMALFIPAR